MRILHTADWHLGHRLHENGQHEEHQLFFDWLIKTIDEEKIDVLLVSGDIYDTGVPSTQSQKMYYDFLIKLQQTHCSEVVITGGNHDAPGTINAPKELLAALSVRVIGKATEDVAEEVFCLKVADEEVIVAAIPYLRDQDIRRAVQGESFDDITSRYKQALVNHYQEAADECVALGKAGVPLIAMGHLFAVGGSVSDSEQQIYVGNLGHIGAEDFPKAFDYIALGHLHRPQLVGERDYIRYSGSPVMLSFSETGYEKQILILETGQNEIKSIRPIAVPVFRELIRISGTMEECIGRIQNLTVSESALTPWLEITLDTTQQTVIDQRSIHEVAEEKRAKVLKVAVAKKRKTKGVDQLLSETTSVKDLSPVEVFKQKCAEEDYPIEDHSEIMDAFEEALQLAREQ
ncbi:MAG: exonuclease SbcCD subunit D C-terminal domain-containing protein [Cyclobacteriaceae bacterium]